MKIHVRCGRLFTGHADTAAENQTVVVENGRVAAVLPTAGAPAPGPEDTVVVVATQVSSSRGSRFTVDATSDDSFVSSWAGLTGTLGNGPRLPAAYEATV
jgi:hypothetical protein